MPTSEGARAAQGYGSFLDRKSQHTGDGGFVPTSLPDFLYPFQRDLVTWSLRRGRAAIFADCGLGKTPMQLAWADAIARRTGRPVLIVTPLAVGAQVVAEGEKFGIEVTRSRDGTAPPRGVAVTNYERLHLFSAADFAGCVLDESSILKNFDGARRGVATEFLRCLPYRLLCTATAAPNDYVELGTSSEALGELGHMDMLARFFVNDQGNSTARKRAWGTQGGDGKFRFRGHAEDPFWRWVCSWARACRRPSDLGYDDQGFVLPPLKERHHVVAARTVRDGWLFEVPAVGLAEEREERRRTIEERCEMVAQIVEGKEQALVWCHLNDEGNRLAKLIPGAAQVKGGDADDQKEETLTAFARGDLRVLVTKPKIGCWGLNLQRCAHVVTFPTHSFEQHYQGVRRCWRFGQTRPVVVDVVATEGERAVMENLARKAKAADDMFAALVARMNEASHIARSTYNPTKTEIPSWL